MNDQNLPDEGKKEILTQQSIANNRILIVIKQSCLENLKLWTKHHDTKPRKDASYSTTTRSRKAYTLKPGNRHRVVEDIIALCEAIEAAVGGTMGVRTGRI